MFDVLLSLVVQAKRWPFLRCGRSPPHLILPDALRLALATGIHAETAVFELRGVNFSDNECRINRHNARVSARFHYPAAEALSFGAGKDVNSCLGTKRA